MGMVDSFSRTSGSYGDQTPPMRESRRLMLTQLEDAISETVRLVVDQGPADDAEALETLDLLAEVYDVCKNGSKE